MSFISELVASNGTTRTQEKEVNVAAPSNNSDSETSDPAEPEKENTKLISIKELVARNTSRDRPALVVMDQRAETSNSNSSKRQQLLDLLHKKVGDAAPANDSNTATPSSTAPSSPLSSPQMSTEPSSARNTLNDRLMKRQLSHKPASATTEPKHISPKAARTKKRPENPALQALLAQRSGSVSTSSSTANESKKHAIAELLAKRVAPHLTPEQDTIVPASDARKSALADMLAKRNGGNSAGGSMNDDKNRALADMLSKRQGKPSKPAAAAAQSTSDPKANALAKMLVKRGKATTTPVPTEAPRNPVADMFAKRAAASVPSSRGDARSNGLAEMLAKRNGNATSTKKPVSNPLEEMLAKRNDSATPKRTTNPLEEMLTKRHVDATAAEPEPSTDSTSDKPNEQAAAPEEDEHFDTPLRDHPKYATYFKMLKIGQPPEVVRHRMRREGVDIAILDWDPSKPLPKETVAKSDVDDQDPEYLAALKKYNENMPKYQQMLKMGLPRGAVEHKMQMQGVDLTWLDGPPQPKKKAPTGPTEAEITAHREKYHQYFQMLKMGLPRGAVEHKMRMAGVDPRELDGPIVAGTAPASATGTALRGLPPAPSIKNANSIRKKLHWEVKRQESRNSQRESLWNLTLDEDSTLSQVRISQESKAMLEKLFVKDMTVKATETTAPTTGTNGKKPAKKQVMYLIDMKKSQNISITLARIKLSFAELKREILALNPTVLSTAQLQSLMDMWPDQTEQVAIDNFHGEESTIGAAEKFLVEVRNIPRFKEKLGCLVFKQEFPTRVHEIRESINLVIRGVNQVCCSSALQQLFIYILRTGNLLNFGTDDASAVSVGGFSLNSLVKLSQTKAFTGGLTFLQYIVQCIERDIPQLARFPQQINLIQKCSKVSIASLFSEKRALEEGLKSLTHEAKAVVPAERDADAELGASILKHFATEVEMELDALQALLDQMMDCKTRFLEYFEEEETSEELDMLLSHIASFTLDFERKHSKHLEQLDKVRLQAQQKQEQEAKKQKLQHAKASRNSLHENPLRHQHRSNQHGHHHSHGHGHHPNGHGHPFTVALKHTTKSGETQGKPESQENQDPKSNTNYFPQFVVDRLKKQPSSTSETPPAALTRSNSAMRSVSMDSEKAATHAV